MIGVLGSLAQPLPVDPVPIERPGVDWGAVAPMLVLVGGALALMLASSFVSSRRSNVGYTIFTCLVGLGAIGAAIPLWIEVTDDERGPFSTLAGSVGVDGFSTFVTFLLGAAVVLAALFIDDYLRREQLEGVEAYVLLLLSATGGVIMAHANDLIVLFLGLEVLSMAAYVLAAMHRRRVTSQEAGMKYFVLGAFSSAFFLYGIAMIYGGTGTTNLVDDPRDVQHHRADRGRPRPRRPGAACWWGWGSRWRRCRSTSGRPTSTRDRRRRWWRGWRRG